ncbi:mitochondrial 54S ribosomal protein YmL35 [Dimargaris verticillata]|uniref:Mitochondrial 54S ribosomal protein YmL35 n=1 Tax=Dimargaris verticillata TaxID=2761393 RepID=A0A9W8B373_9FUNG|nr:mitochondrial 54S ribosomal protein YmL35 [Dimargaris verticillata]
MLRSTRLISHAVRVLPNRTATPSLTAWSASVRLATNGVRFSSEVAYKPPALNVNPAYDSALAYLEGHKREQLAKADQIAQQIERLQQDPKTADTTSQVQGLKDQEYELRVDAMLYDSQVLWNFAHGQGDLTVPVYHYLAQQQFREEYLPVLMQRVTQMHVVPDLLPAGAVQPEFRVQMRYPSIQESFMAGVKLEPKDTLDTPSVSAMPFHIEPRLYTLALVDPDHPCQETQQYTERCHWLKTNVSLSVTQHSADAGNTILEYLPPHPALGTKHHRYVLMLLEQPLAGQSHLDLSSLTSSQRTFGTRALCAAHNLTLRGVTFFRAQYDEAVASVYQDILKMPNPVYGPKPQVDPRVQPDGRMFDRYKHY